MNRNHRILLLSAATLAGGLAAAALLAPERVQTARRAIGGRLPAAPRRLDVRLNHVEERIAMLERRIQETTDEFRQRLSDAGQRTLDRYVPDDALAGSEWHLKKGDVDQDLPRITGKE